MDASPPQVNVKGLTVVAPVCDQLFGHGFGTSRTTFRNPDQTPGLLSQLDFRLLSAVQQDDPGKTVPLLSAIPLVPLPFLVSPTAWPPFGRCKAAIQKGPVPFQPPLFIQGGK